MSYRFPLQSISTYYPTCLFKCRLNNIPLLRHSKDSTFQLPPVIFPAFSITSLSHSCFGSFYSCHTAPLVVPYMCWECAYFSVCLSCFSACNTILKATKLTFPLASDCLDILFLDWPSSLTTLLNKTNCFFIIAQKFQSLLLQPISFILSLLITFEKCKIYYFYVYCLLLICYDST